MRLLQTASPRRVPREDLEDCEHPRLPSPRRAADPPMRRRPEARFQYRLKQGPTARAPGAAKAVSTASLRASGDGAQPQWPPVLSAQVLGRGARTERYIDALSRPLAVGRSTAKYQLELFGVPNYVEFRYEGGPVDRGALPPVTGGAQPSDPSDEPDSAPDFVATAPAAAPASAPAPVRTPPSAPAPFLPAEAGAEAGAKADSDGAASAGPASPAEASGAAGTSGSAEVTIDAESSADAAGVESASAGASVEANAESGSTASAAEASSDSGAAYVSAATDAADAPAVAVAVEFPPNGPALATQEDAARIEAAARSQEGVSSARTGGDAAGNVAGNADGNVDAKADAEDPRVAESRVAVTPAATAADAGPTTAAGAPAAELEAASPVAEPSESSAKPCAATAAAETAGPEASAASAAGAAGAAPLDEESAAAD